MAQQQIVQIAEGAAMGAISDMDPQKQREVLGVLGVGGKFGVLLPFSRKHESEADRIGLLLMAASGRDPHAAVDFWKRMSKLNGKQPMEFMSTHPSHERRVADLERLMDEAIPFYEHAAHKVPDRPLPLSAGSAAAATSENSGASGDALVESPPEPGIGSTRPRRGVPEQAMRVLRFIEQNNRAPKGYEGGREFMNLGKSGEQSLPNFDSSASPIKYREWDVHPHVQGRNRGTDRLVTGSDGSAYYTSDHYRTFIRIR